MVLPIGANRFEEALQMGSETYHHLKVFHLNCLTFEIISSVFLLVT